MDCAKKNSKISGVGFSCRCFFSDHTQQYLPMAHKKIERYSVRPLSVGNLGVFMLLQRMAPSYFFTQKKCEGDNFDFFRTLPCNTYKLSSFWSTNQRRRHS